MDLAELAARYDERLRTDDFADLDASENGVQVGPDDHEVETVAFAVDAAEQTVEAAADRGADALVVHHGLSWGGIDRVTGRTYDRVAPLVENDIALYVSHLPLDAHPDLGNAAGVADLLDLEEREPRTSPSSRGAASTGSTRRSRRARTPSSRARARGRPTTWPARAS